MLRLNAGYHFHSRILREYRINEKVPSKSKFDRFNFDAALDKHISANLDHYLDLFKKIYANQQGYQQYMREVNNVIRQDPVKPHEAKKDFLHSKDSLR